MEELTKSLILLVDKGFVSPDSMWRIIKQAIHVKYGIGYLYLEYQKPFTGGKEPLNEKNKTNTK